jgi:hypothetical protein
MAQKTVILGCLERVSFPDLGITEACAKVDTGAYSGALHCTNIKIARRGVLRKRVLQFTPLGDPKLATETDTFAKIPVKSAFGHSVKRYLVDTTIEVQGVPYTIRIGLADRSEMKRPVLLGRRFMRENAMLVDVQINQEDDDEGEMTS